MKTKTLTEIAEAIFSKFGVETGIEMIARLSVNQLYKIAYGNA